MAASDLWDEMVDSESEMRAAPRLYVDDDNERTRSPRQSYVDLAGLRSFDDPTRIGVPRPSYVARGELAPSSSEPSESFPAPRRSHVAVKELHDEDRCDLETVTKHVVLPSTYVPSSDVERVDAYARTEKVHPYTDSEEELSEDELSSEDIEVMAHDVLAHTDEQPVIEPERLDLDALGPYLFDDCGLPPVPEPPRPPSSRMRPQAPSVSEPPAPVFDRTMAVPSQPPPAQDNPLLARLAEIQRVMEQRQRALSVLAEEEVRPSLRRPAMPPPPASWGWSVPGGMRHPTEPAMLFGLPTPPPRKSQSLKPVLASVACAGLGLFIAALIALALVFMRSEDSEAAAARAAVDVPTPVLVETVASTDAVTAPPSFIVIGDPLEEPPAPPAASPTPSPRATTPAATPAAPAAPQKVAASAAAKPEGAPAATTTSRAKKSGEKSVEEILAELGEEQLRR